MNVIIIAILAIINFSNSLQVLDSKNSRHLVSDLINYFLKDIRNERNDFKEYYDLTRTKDNKGTNYKYIDNNEDTDNRNRVLVKRVLSHGAKYNDLNTKTMLYKPLFRVHVQPISNQNVLKRNYIHKINENNDKYLYSLPKYVNSLKDNLLQSSVAKHNMDLPIDKDTKRFKTSEAKLIKKVLKILNDFQSYNKKIRFYDKLTKIVKNLEDFRTMNDGIVETDKESQSNLSTDILKVLTNFHSNNGKIIFYDKLKDIVQDLEDLGTNDVSNESFSLREDTRWYPHYPPWNYWTYYKNLHQDECPIDQVKVHNMCIWIPPHRRK